MYLNYIIIFEKYKKKYLDRIPREVYYECIVKRYKKKRDITVKKQSLQGHIVKHDKKQSVLADAMGLSLSRLNAKINETNAEFTQLDS